MDSAFEMEKDDVREMRARAKWHAILAVRLGIIGIVLVLPLALEAFAAPLVAAAAIAFVLAAVDATDGSLHRSHKRFGIVLFLGVLAHVAWIPVMIEDGKPSPLLFVTLVGFMIMAIGSMSTVWAQADQEKAFQTEAHRAKVRENLETHRKIGQHGDKVGPLTRAEIERSRQETGGKATTRATAWRGTPSHVNVTDERHPGKSAP